mgnify:CR=1 FL=1
MHSLINWFLAVTSANNDILLYSKESLIIWENTYKGSSDTNIGNDIYWLSSLVVIKHEIGNYTDFRNRTAS